MTEPEQLVDFYYASNFPTDERWRIYSQIKRGRENLERQGIRMHESYGSFISRITTDLEL